MTINLKQLNQEGPNWVENTVMYKKDERNDRQKKSYRTPSMTVYVMRNTKNLMLMASPGVGGDEPGDIEEG